MSGGDLPETLTIDQDAHLSISALGAGQEVVHKSRMDRKAYLFVIAGHLTLNGMPLEKGDQAGSLTSRNSGWKPRKRPS